jgi:hypothetical protein
MEDPQSTLKIQQDLKSFENEQLNALSYEDSPSNQIIGKDQ